MKRFRNLRAAPVPVFLALAVAAGGVVAGRAGASLKPTGDIVERFGADPLTLQDLQGRFIWFANGSWTWEPRGTTFSSKGPGGGSLLWMPGSHYTGTLSLRFRLEAQEGRARLLFAADPATGAHRWLEATAGDSGRITLGQSGSLGGSSPGVIQTWRTAVAVGVWQEISLALAGDMSVTVSLGGRKLFTAAAAPLVAGLVGFGSAGGPVAFDEFKFTADPDGEPCFSCHSGQADQPLAANVYKYWDGRWWDATYHVNATAQQGGHGDPGGKPALGCTGANGCHDLRQPQSQDHRNGTREGHRNGTLVPAIPATVNSFHLRSGFIVENPANPWDVQIAFDTYCTAPCHAAASVPAMSHDKDGLPVPGAVQFRTRGTVANRDGERISLPVDSDITRRATTPDPDFAPCVSCHDPHGTGVMDSGNPARNYMLRKRWYSSSSLCVSCH